MSTTLSVNLNKVALLRNSRGRGVPDLLPAAETVIAAGAGGITLHPRLDQRHVRFDDVPRVAVWLREAHPGIELNLECEDDPSLIDLVIAAGPDQCTLVPVTPGEVTSDHGWDLPTQTPRLQPVVARLSAAGIRTSAFAECDPERISAFAEVGVDRVELYTGPYAWAHGTVRGPAETARVAASAAAARAVGLGVNAGHDLDRHNLVDLAPLDLDEVSIGHALVCRALQVGLAAGVTELLAALTAPRRSAP